MAAAVLQYHLRGLLHRGEGAANQVVSVDDNVHAVRRKFILRRHVVGRGNDDKRRFRVVLAEGVAESEHLVRRFRLRVNHDAVRARFDVGVAAGQRIIEALFQNQALAARDNHEILRFLRIFARCDFLAKVGDARLFLSRTRAKQAVLLQPLLVLDDDGADARAFQRLHVVDKVLDQPAGVAVQNNWLRRHFHDFFQRVQAAGHVHQFNIRFSLRGGVAQAADPNCVELAAALGCFDGRLFDNQPCQAVVRLHHGQARLVMQQAAEAAPARLRQGEQLIKGRKRLLGRGVRVGEFHQLAAPAFERLNDFLTDIRLIADEPVIPMHHNVRAQAVEDVRVIQTFLHDDAADVLQPLKHRNALLQRNQRIMLVACDDLVRQQADGHFAQLRRALQNADMPVVQNIRRKANVHLLHSKYLLTESSQDNFPIRLIVDFSAEPPAALQRIQRNLP